MRRIVPAETFNPDPDARYHRSLLEAFPVRGSSQLLLLQSRPRSWRRCLSAIGQMFQGRRGD
ncbi:Uncharacterised protein [Delftia tsuruhatensis]|uniref:hypothetical protein n=1 Tax=Delftia tsuruhatensis TaxID=180282 RepID=UPI001E7783A8|nr:hypothetical protein [Delftia tsuruhatensis]CAB5709387.1 Uncharacterised protein [Delftia tsuruhatensis]CAC9685321.1 Uncharacterised protein [Delftia tsuruhatensis]